MRETSKGQAFGFLFFTFFIWGSVYVAGKLIADAVPPGLLACCGAPAPWPPCS